VLGIASHVLRAKALWQFRLRSDTPTQEPSNLELLMYSDVRDASGPVERSDGSLKNLRV
jgi:hypothetical protein